MDAVKPLPSNKSPGKDWLNAVKSKLGNCATEITLTAPNELTLERSGPIGLTGFEMSALEYWLDAPGFPLNAIYPRFNPSNLPKKQAVK
jgi:hypothetical protein